MDKRSDCFFLTCPVIIKEVFKPSLILPAEIPSCFIFNEKWQRLRLAVSAARAGRAEAKTLQTTESGPGQLRQAGGRARSSQKLAKTAELARQDGGDHLKCRRYWDTESEK